MGLIYKKVRFKGSKASKVLNALMDTGASESLIRAREARMIGEPFEILEPLVLELGEGKVTVSEVISAIVTLNRHLIHWLFYVVPDLTEEAIIGADFFQRYKIKLDPKTERLIIDPKRLKMKLV